MKTKLILICSFIFITAYAQKSKKQHQDEILFEKGLALQMLVSEELDLNKIIEDENQNPERIALAQDIKDDILYKAREYYQELIDKYPKSRLRFRALNNEAFVDLALKDQNAACNIFKKILDSEANDREAGGIGSGIMSEPYTNYKNRAAKMIASIYMDGKNYKDALNYLMLTKKYPYQHFCGNEYAADEIYMAEQYGKCYLGLEDTTMAMRYLLPNIFSNGLASNNSLVTLTYQTLVAKYGRDSLSTLFNTAVNHYKTEQSKTKDNARMYIVFLETKIEIPSYMLGYGYEENDHNAFIEESIKKQQFYQLVNH